MGILNFLRALVGLLVGAPILNFVPQALEGRKTYFPHFGYVTMTGGGVTVWSILPPLRQQLFGDDKPSSYLWYGAEPGGAPRPSK